MHGTIEYNGLFLILIFSCRITNRWSTEDGDDPVLTAINQIWNGLVVHNILSGRYCLVWWKDNISQTRPPIRNDSCWRLGWVLLNLNLQKVNVNWLIGKEFMYLTRHVLCRLFLQLQSFCAIRGWSLYGQVSFGFVSLILSSKQNVK